MEASLIVKARITRPQLVALCSKLLQRLSNDERLKLMEEIMQGFCKDCGRELGPDPFRAGKLERCHCTNDE